jgi:hypothetical protein
MKIKLSIIIIVLIFTGGLIFSGCGSKSYSIKGSAGGKIYTAYNMWYEIGKEEVMWTINYKTGTMIPAGTEVRDVKVKKSEIFFTTVEDKKKFIVNFNAKFHPGKTPENYANMMFSEKDFDQLTKGMRQTDIDGINEGVIMVGMIKKAVIVAYGYPPEHKTPDLDSNVWTYWLNRFTSTTINFDDKGKTIKPK